MSKRRNTNSSVIRFITRHNAWREAVESWFLGDSKPIALFVEKFGARTERERQTIAGMLVSKPTPKKIPTRKTLEVLREIRAMILTKNDYKMMIRDAAERALTEEEITALRAAILTNQEIFEVVAQKFEMQRDTVERYWKRYGTIDRFMTAEAFAKGEGDTIRHFVSSIK